MNETEVQPDKATRLARKAKTGKATELAYVSTVENGYVMVETLPNHARVVQIEVSNGDLGTRATVTILAETLARIGNDAREFLDALENPTV